MDKPSPLKGKESIAFVGHYKEEVIRAALELSFDEINNLIPPGTDRISDKTLKPMDVFNILYKNFEDVIG